MPLLTRDEVQAMHDEAAWGTDTDLCRTALTLWDEIGCLNRKLEPAPGVPLCGFRYEFRPHMACTLPAGHEADRVAHRLEAQA